MMMGEYGVHVISTMCALYLAVCVCEEHACISLRQYRCTVVFISYSFETQLNNYHHFRLYDCVVIVALLLVTAAYSFI